MRPAYRKKKFGRLGKKGLMQGEGQLAKETYPGKRFDEKARKRTRSTLPGENFATSKKKAPRGSHRYTARGWRSSKTACRKKKRSNGKRNRAQRRLEVPGSNTGGKSVLLEGTTREMGKTVGKKRVTNLSTRNTLADDERKPAPGSGKPSIGRWRPRNRCPHIKNKSGIDLKVA